MMNELFGEPSTNDNEEETLTVTNIPIGIYNILLETAENDQNDGKITLFATYIWEGSKVLAFELLTLKEIIIKKRILEFGAAAGLPSIIAAKMGAELVCASDYPSFEVLKVLQRNLHRNHVSDKVKVVDHIWGSNVSSLLSINENQKYDIVIMAECLWRHDCQEDLLRSIVASIADQGRLIAVYSHHVTGLELQDDAFLQKAVEIGFRLNERKTVLVPHQWRPEDKKPVFICHYTYHSTPTS